MQFEDMAKSTLADDIKKVGDIRPDPAGRLAVLGVADS